MQSIDVIWLKELKMATLPTQNTSAKVTFEVGIKKLISGPVLVTKNPKQNYKYPTAKNWIEFRARL